MSDEVWGDGRFSYEEPAVGGAAVMINGSTIPIEAGSSFRDTIKNVSLDAGLGKYRVFLNGSEIRPSEAPVAFNAGDKAEIRPYDVAGQR